MIRMHNLPGHIKESLKPYYKDSETPDVFPAKFNIHGKLYYYFTFVPAGEQLIMKHDGTVPAFEEVKKEALILNSFNVCGEGYVNIGAKWVKANRIGNYMKLKDILIQIKNKLGPFPKDIEEAYKVLIKVPDMIIEKQKIIENCVKTGDEIWLIASKREVVTEEDEQEMHQSFVEMIRAQVRQNDIQLQTENERNKMIDYVSSKKGLFNLTALYLYIKLIPYKKYMLNSKSKEAIGWEELKNSALYDDLQQEREKNANVVLGKLRNPR